MREREKGEKSRCDIDSLSNEREEISGSLFSKEAKSVALLFILSNAPHLISDSTHFLFIPFPFVRLQQQLWNVNLILSYL